MASFEALPTGLQAFVRFYSECYGSRWKSVIKAVEEAPANGAQLAKLSSFLSTDECKKHLPEGAIEIQAPEGSGALVEAILRKYVRLPQGVSIVLPESIPYDYSFLRPYCVVDLADVLLNALLSANPGDEIIDLHASRASRTALIAEQLRGDGLLVANYRTSAARDRILQGLHDCIPEDMRACVRLTNHECDSWPTGEVRSVHKVLLDAPCTKEKELLESAQPEFTHNWRESQTKRMAKQQLQMLVNAMRLVTKGGTVVYSTRSLSPLENDGVVLKALAKCPELEIDILRKEQFDSHIQASLDVLVPCLEETDGGYMMLPDRNGGEGPLFFTVLRRASNQA